MKLRQISFKIVSLVMVLSILFGVSATTISASTAGLGKEEATTKEDYNYVSIGASNVNGYGMDGYLEEDVYEHPLLKEESNIYGYKQDTPGSYPVLIKEALSSKYNVNLSQLAISSMRAEEVRFLLDDSYKGDAYTDWRFYDVPGVDRYNADGTVKSSQNWFYLAGALEWQAQGNNSTPTQDEAVNALKNAYKDAIKNADLITVDIGVNNFGVYASNQIVSNLYSNDVSTLDPEIAAKYEEGKAYVLELIAEKAQGIEIPEETLEHMADTMAYALVGFCLSFDAIMEQVYTLNPDATVVVVSIQNLMEGLYATLPGVEETIPFGEMFGALVNAANVYTAVVSPYAEKYLYTDVRANGHVEFFSDELLNYNGDPSTLSGDMKDCFDVYDNDLYIKTRVQQILAIQLYNAGLLNIDAAVANGLNVANQNNPTHFAIAYQHDLLTIPALGCTLEEFFIAGEAGLLPDVAVPYYEGYAKALATAHDVMAEIFQDGLKLNTLDASTFGQNFGPVEDKLLGSFFGILEGAVMASVADPTFEFELDDYYPDGIYNTIAEQAGVPVEFVNTVAVLGIRTGIGNSFFGHPNGNGHKELAEAILATLENGTTGTDVALGELIIAIKQLAQYVSENYEEIYADVHTELREQGVIDELNNYIDIASKAIADAYDVVYGAEFGERFELTKEYILAELGLMDATLVQIHKLVNYETITPETLVTLNALLANLQDHAENLANLGIELATITNEQLMFAVAELKAQAWAQLEILNAELETAVGEAREAILAEIARIQAQLDADIAELVAFANEIKAVIDNAVNSVIDTVEYTKDFAVNFANSVYTYIYNQAPETYEQLVDALVDAIAVYSHEAAKLAYNWLINNPEKVIEFFDVYGDDIVDIFVKYHEVIFSVLGYVGMTYGEDILYLVLDNADVILPAIYGWFEIHGDLVWDLIVVYFNAIVEYYNLGLDLDFSTPDGIHASLNKIFSLLGELLSMIADGIYDLADALNLIDELEAALAALDAQIRYQIETVLGQIDAHVAEKIALITAQINKQIETLKAQAEKQLAILYAQLETAVGEAREAILAEIAKIEAELAAQIEALKAQLEALINAEIENAGDLVTALDKLLQDGTYALGQLIYDAIVAYVNDAIRGEFTPNEETIYVSISSGDDAYAQLVAEALSAVAKSEITAESTIWGDLDYDLLAKADLVTIGYSATELSSFAVAQLFGYVKEFIDNDVRNSGLDYVDSVFAGFHAYIDGLNASLGEYGNVEIDTSDEEAYVNGEINGFVDALIGAGEISDEHYELMGDYGMVALLAGMFFADATLEELDWAQYVGEDNLHYVDDLRAAIRSELLKQGVMDNYVIEVPVLDYALNYVFGDADYITYEGVTIKRAMLEKHLEGAENYTIAIPVVDSLVFAIESYIYSNVAFNYQYGQLIVDLYETNPDVTIVLLGQYNAFDYEIDVFGEYIDLGGLYSYVAQINSVQPFAYALLSENVAYVDISDAETYYESFLNDGTDDSLLNFVLNFVLDPSITDLSEAGHEYVYEQIMKVLTLNCDHVYDNACDTTCNKCGAIREVAGHVYVDGECIHCGAIDPDYIPEEPEIPDAPTHNFHVFDDCNDATCNECNYVRVVVGHVFDDCVDATCYMCDYVREEVPGHLFGNCGEDTCERCGKTRPATTHVYNNACDADCNRCGVTREVPAHVYSGCTDATCNVCGAEREASAHTISNKCTDNICDVCGQNVAVNGHVFGAWTVTVEPTRKTEGKQTRTCTGCGLVETATIDALGGIGGGAIAAIVTGSTAVTGAGGFGIYWFLIQKKTFAQLLAALGKGAVESAAVAAEAGAAAAEAGAVAAEAAAEAGAEAAAEAAEAAAETIAE